MTTATDGTPVAVSAAADAAAASAAVAEGGGAEDTLADAAAAASALVPEADDWQHSPPPTPPAGVRLSTPLAGVMSRVSEGTSMRGTSTPEYPSERYLAATPRGAAGAAPAAAGAVGAAGAAPAAAGAVGAAGAASASPGAAPAGPGSAPGATASAGAVLPASGPSATSRPSSPWRWRPHAGPRARRSTAPQHGQSALSPLASFTFTCHRHHGLVLDCWY
jgi:hypothetical protein